MNITTNPYLNYSQANTQLFAYDLGQPQNPKAQAEPVGVKYQDRVSLSGVGENLLDFFSAGAAIAPGMTLEQQLKLEQERIRGQLFNFFEQQGVATDQQLTIRKGASDAADLQVGGTLPGDALGQLAEKLNADEPFKLQYDSAEQLKRLSVAVAKAKMRIETMTKEGRVPQYRDLQQVKEEVEQLFQSVSLNDGQLDFQLTD